MKLKKFNQFKSDGWIGPVEILDYKPHLLYYSVVTNLGEFKTNSTDLRTGYSYLLKVVGDRIVETGMSCVDLVVFVDTGSNYKMLAIKRGKNPFQGMWALPGGNIDEAEHPIDAAIRELEEETGLTLKGMNLTPNTHNEHLTPVGIFDEPYRDPRNKNCVSYAFGTILNEIPSVTAGDDATEADWIDVSYDGDISVDMAFDHKEIVKKAVSILKK
jgi:8-oxo-dGTP diphosphatase